MTPLTRSSQSVPRKPLASVRATALRMLARRDFPRAELARRLENRGAEATELARVLDELEQLGYLSDARYAQMIVAQRAGRYGKRAIAQALSQRRVASPAAQAALAELNGGDELAQATALWERRFDGAPSNDRERARQVRFLIARGYGMAIALRVVRRPPRSRAPDDIEPA